jgi:membrane protease YdiL (CAAX protease family)
MVRTLRAVGWAAVLAFVVAGFFSLTWGALLAANFLTTPAVPWSVAVMAIVLVVVLLYLGGRWGPKSTADWRRAHLRARLVPGRVLGWALLAGALALSALVGLWIVLVELTQVGGNPTIPSSNQIPPVALGLMLVMGSFVSSLTEEAAFRGYAQVTLERVMGGVGAVAISSLYFMLWHGPTQGFQWSKLLFYYLVGVVFGTIAFLTKSTVPAWPIHLAGDLIFFFLIWPHDATRRYIFRDGADVWFWVYAAVTVVFTVLAILAFRRLGRITKRAALEPEIPARMVEGQ